MTWENKMFPQAFLDKYPLIALVVIGMMALGAFYNSRDNYTATMALKDRFTLEKRIASLEIKMNHLQDTVNTLKIPPQWFEDKVHKLENFVQEIQRNRHNHE